MKTASCWMLVAAILISACGGSDFDQEDPATDSGTDSAETETGDVDQAPPKGVDACVAWENGPKPLSSVAACPLDDTCAEWTREFWHQSCADDCASLDVNQVQCVCECMVNATPWDGAISQPCEVDYEDLYDCWMDPQ